MHALARGRNLLARLRRGRSSSLDQARAVNLSYVLHEHSASSVVRAAVQATSQHSKHVFNSHEPIVDGKTDLSVDCWLVPSVGQPESVANALKFAGFPDAMIYMIDRSDEPTIDVPFFRATAALTLPDSSHRIVGVAALVMRPGGQSGQLILRGPFDWPEEIPSALRTIESVIQAHIQQWVPDRQLWSDPIEDTLSDEVR